MASRHASTRRRRRPREDRLDAIFRALGDRTRRDIVARLRRGPATVAELAAPFAISMPAISRHVRVLEEAGLIVRAVQGRTHHCSLAAEALRDVAVWLAHYRQFWDATLESLADYLSDREPPSRR